jgi:hypothetical protein
LLGELLLLLLPPPPPPPPPPRRRREARERVGGVDDARLLATPLLLALLETLSGDCARDVEGRCRAIAVIKSPIMSLPYIFTM